MGGVEVDAAELGGGEGREHELGCEAEQPSRSSTFDRSTGSKATTAPTPSIAAT